MDRVLILLIISDILILSSFGLVAPILAIFIKDELAGGGVVAAGIATSIFWLVKSVLQLPLSRVIDSRRKKTGFLIAGTLIIAIVPFIYMLSEHVYHLYIAQAVYAVGASMAYPAWISLFTMHLNRKHRGFEWAIWSTGIGIGTGIAAFVGAELAILIGFRYIFLVVGLVSLAGMFILIFIDRKYAKLIEREIAAIENIALDNKLKRQRN